MRLRRRRDNRGSIPACAGEPVGEAQEIGQVGVYPRVCGGTEVGAHGLLAGGGLSPRVRGNRGLPALWPELSRSIPACAGEPGRSRRGGRRPGVYPRVCGGTRWSAAMRSAWAGLSPRVRGNLVELVQLHIRQGSIPACAGEPRASRIPPQIYMVYPRVCGGTWPHKLNALAGQGLSPRVRGNPAAATITSNAGRSIPACAGEPPVVAAVAAVIGVYPRVCGGTTAAAAGVPIAPGLSPRVRGNPVRPAGGCATRRSIPACAGEPVASRRLPTGLRVYPRVCGGTAVAGVVVAHPQGLSPRVRGNQTLESPPLVCYRSIPACAGEPQRR